MSAMGIIYNQQSLSALKTLYRSQAMKYSDRYPLLFLDSDKAEIIAMANDTEYDQETNFCCRNIGRIWHVAEGPAAGMCGVNGGMISNAAAPFDGVKQSGNGREGSRYGLDDYSEIEILCMGGPTAERIKR